MTQIHPQAPVMVTGANGYLGSWIVKYLLEQGYTVHGTVRDPNKSASVAHLQKIAEGSKGTLKLFAADLLQAGSFDAAMQGCELVMHTASPFIMKDYDDANTALVQPALQGTRHVLEAIERTPTVKRLVLTSSVASIYGDAQDIQKAQNGIFTEADWNVTSSVKHQPYPYSKVVAEREAWAWHEQQNRWDLVTINPALIMGPALTTQSISASITTLQQFGDGTMAMGTPELYTGLVDVRDVAEAHIIAAFKPEAKGRYIISDTVLSLFEMGQALRTHFGSKYPFPKMTAPKAAFWLIAPLFGYQRDFVAKNIGYKIAFDTSRSRKELGLNYRDIRQSLVEHFQQLIDDGLVKKRG